MKLYYDNSGTWTEVTGIITLPVPLIRMDTPSMIVVEIRDFEGALYSTWISRDFVDMLVTDGAASPTNLFYGYISGTKYTHDALTIEISSFGRRLEGVPLNYNYVLEQGKVSEVPAVIPEIHESNANPEAPDVTAEWDSNRPGNDWDALDSNEYAIWLIGNNTNKIEELNMETFVIAAVTEIKVYLGGFRASDGGYPANPQVDIWVNGGWEGYKTVLIPEDEWGVGHVNYPGAWNQNDLNDLKVRIKGTTVNAQLIMIRRMYCRVYYEALDLSVLGLEDLKDPPQPFDWAEDQWNSGFQNKGILITDSTKGTEYNTWKASACSITNHDTKDETFGHTHDADEGDYVWARETAQTYDAVIDFTIDGAVVPRTNYLQKIEIDYQFGHWINANGTYVTYVFTELQIKKDADWITLKTFTSRILPDNPDIRRWVSIPTIVIEDTNAELLKYLDVDNGNYDELKGLRFVTDTFRDDIEMGIVITEVDYISVRIYFNSLDISPIMETIDDSEDHWIGTTGIDWTATGVAVGDSFKIGENTTQILTDIDVTSGVTINIQSTLSKYIAQWFKGTYCIEILRKVCLLEGLHWWEDHQQKQIVVSKEADFVDSTVDLTQADYLWDWQFENNSNQYKAVEVFGSSTLRIYYKATDLDTTNTSHLVKSIIEETILTNPEAKKIADAQLLEYKVKRQSITIPLNGVQADLGVGKTVTLTMARPTVAEDDYPIRMIQREQIGINNIKTTIWCGLGKSTVEEKIANIINNAMYLAHKAHTDRLISTPAGEGAVITWGDIGGSHEGVKGVIGIELIDGGIIDNAIDALICATRTVELPMIIESAAHYNARVQLDAVNDGFRFQFYIHSGVDASSDITFTFIHQCASADATVACLKWFGAHPADGSEAWAWDISNGVAVNLDSTNANRDYTTTIVIANANFSAGDIITGILRLNEAARVLGFKYTSATYTKKVT